MRKLWGKVITLITQNKKNTFIFSFSIIVLLVLVFKGPLNSTSKADDTSSKVKGSSKVSESQLKKIIEENKAKYGLKRDWLGANPQNLPLSAKASVIVDYDSNELLFADNENEKLFPASITKVLTAKIVLENMKTDLLCEVSERAAQTEPNKISMRAGEKLRVEDLLYGLMMISANDAAETLAECYPGGREAFIEKMNQKVKELGLESTHFINPSGLHDDNHYSSAYDMAVITNYALKSDPNYIKYFGNKEDYSVFESENNDSHWWQQISNLLQTYPGMDGAKTGFTYEAGNTYIGTASQDGKRIIIVYLNANSTTYDAKTMLDQGFYLANIK